MVLSRDVVAAGSNAIETELSFVMVMSALPPIVLRKSVEGRFAE
jgi:hypothetical protein